MFSVYSRNNMKAKKLWHDEMTSRFVSRLRLGNIDWRIVAILRVDHSVALLYHFDTYRTSTFQMSPFCGQNQFCGLFTSFDNEDESVLTAKSMDDDRIHPFIAYDDGYRFPDLFTEIDEMIETNCLILSMPLTHAQVMELIQSNSTEVNAKSLEVMEERNMLEHSSEPEEGKTMTAKQRKLSPASIIAFDDEFEEEELVYMIELNHARKRVTVCFRGSSTKLDWATDSEMYMKEVPNPVKTHPGQEPIYKVHHGFYNYLFAPTLRGATGPNGEALSQCQEILQEHVMPVIREHPGYKVSLVHVRS
jgi:Lipase (class 3)